MNNHSAVCVSRTAIRLTTTATASLLAALFRAAFGFLFRAATSGLTTTANLSGGTKEYRDATGHFVATRVLDFCTGAAVGSYTAKICKLKGIKGPGALPLGF